MIIKPFGYHDQFKDMLLQMIEGEPANTVKTEWEQVSRSDYTMGEFTWRPYYRFLHPYLINDLQDIFKELDFTTDDFRIVNYWFQQYHKTDLYSWHRHSHSSWIMVYYLELPKGTPQTQIVDLWDNKTIITADVKEGDILILPGMIKHCSPVNKCNKRKTVIAFNTVVY